MGKRYALSDVHAHYDALIDTLSLVDLEKEANELIFLGDYINRGSQGYEVLHYLMKLEQQYPNQVTILLGNHDQSLIDWLTGKKEFAYFHWLDGSLQTLKSFLTKEQYENYAPYFSKPEKVTGALNDTMIQSMLENARDVLTWFLKKKEHPFYYETDTQIFVHAGIKEDEAKWKQKTTEEIFLWKKPAETGFFYKDIIAGHISTALAAQDDKYLGKVYWDQASHFYIDGSVEQTGTLPLLVYDSQTNTYEAYWKEGAHWVKNEIR